MSQLLDRLNFFSKKNVGEFADGHGVVTREDRAWEDGYRKRWQHDKVVRSTHGANCTGSCSWKIYVKGGIVTWETQQTDYPRTRPDLPNHEPRGCSRGASYSWYLYSGNRTKCPLVRSRLLRAWRAERASKSPVAAWKAIVEDPTKRASYVRMRDLGGFVRATWDEVNEIIAAANAYTAKTYGPDRVIGFSPIPAMSMVSYAAGSRYLSLLGGVCMSFYDWYCDLPPSSPQTWGEQTDVPESADWYNSGFLILWGSNVPQTRTPDAHFYAEARYRGAKSVVVSPDYSEAAKFSNLWLHPKQGTDAALAMAMGHVILREFHVDRQAEYFADYGRQYTDMPMLVRLVKKDGHYVPERLVRASDFKGDLYQENNPDWKTVAWDGFSKQVVVPQGAVGFRWGEQGKWNLDEKDAAGDSTGLQRTLIGEGDHDTVADVGFPYFGNRHHDYFRGTDHPDVLVRKVPAKKVALKDGEALVCTVFDLFVANYGLDRGLGGENVAKAYDEMVPYTPAWAEHITGVPAGHIETVAREFARNAEKTHGKSMVILGAGLNHWYHMDMNYRGIINLLVMCGCVGQSGGGWSHYVGQEKLRPQTGWLPLAFALDWGRPPRHMNSTSFWYAHTDQWRYETVGVDKILSPTAPEGPWDGALIDYNVRAERMGWLPSAPQLETNPLEIAARAEAAGAEVKDWKTGAVEPIPGKTMPQIAVVERDYPNLYKRFTALGPLMTKLGNGGKGITWNTDHEVEALVALNGAVTEDGPTKGMARIETDIDATEVILMLAPETNGEVAVKAWHALEKATGREHAHLAVPKEDEKIRFRDVVAQPRKIISSPTWSGLESEKVCYNAGYTNVHERIPWRTLTGRQQLYQDHLWMRAFGESLCVYRPPIDTKTIEPVIEAKANGAKQVVLNFITPHQKWGIHSTYTDNLLMLTLSRGGPIVWISEADAAKAGIEDNDWIEAYNTNGALVARAVVSQRVNEGMVMMYHAQEKIVNVPGSEITGQRGGIHNSVTRAVLKPTHMIGGYAQQAYGFNYYGTVGSNRDEFIVIRKMTKVDWLEGPAGDRVEAAE